MSWQEHRASVIRAQQALTLLAADITEVLDRQDQALAAVTVAVGQEPGTTDGRDAFLKTAYVATKLQEALVEANAANEALSAYGTHF